MQARNNMSINNANLASLKKLAIVGAAWTTVGYGGSQLLRLGSNLILTHLLAPEHFGVMAIVNVFMIGLAMFSDVGIGPSIIQNERGADRKFLNTAWTIQVIRGGVIWLCCLIGAWPFSVFYGEPLLVWLIPVAGFAAVISGFNSTGLFSANRNLTMGYLTIIEIGSQIIAILVMIIMAKIHASIWVLVIGGLTSNFTKMIATHIWLADEHNKFHWDKAAASALVKFGRWIFMSTLLSFFLNSSASLILGKFLTMTELGLFTIASTLSKIVEQIYQQISNKILFPVYAKIRHMSVSEIRQRVFKIRSVIMLVFLPPSWVLVVFGQKIMDLLFDQRYHGAGWILSVLSAGFIPLIIAGIGPFYLAMGNSFLLMKVTAAKFIFYVGSMLIGWWFYGANGIICGMAASNTLAYLIENYLQRKYGIWIAKLDLIGFISSAAVIAAGIGFQQ